MSRGYSFSVIPGDTEVRIFDTDLNLTGCTTAASVICLEDMTSIVPTASITDAPNGKITVTLSPAQTTLIGEHFRHGAVFAVWITDGALAVTTVVHGLMRIDTGGD